MERVQEEGAARMEEVERRIGEMVKEMIEIKKE